MTLSLQLPFSLIKFFTIDNQRDGALNRYPDENQHRISFRRGHMKRLMKETLLERYFAYLISCNPRKASKKNLITLRKDFRITNGDYIFPNLGKNV